jgi:hypothetical protein
MSKLAAISSKPTLRQFAQGAAQQNTSPVADFIAPVVDVPLSVMNYKVYTEKNRFRIPDTRRALGGRATEIGFDVTDASFNCAPHALDFPVDELEKLESGELENVLQEGAIACAEVAGLSHEKKVIDLALATAGAGTSLSVGSSDDIIDQLDAAVLSVIKAAKYGALMGVGIVFGASIWKAIKNHVSVRSRYAIGGKGGAAPLATLTAGDFGQLILGNPEVRASFMVYDDAPEGVDEDIKFVLDKSLLVFARRPQPTRRDPSFMKTFRLAGRYMVPGSYMRDDGRVEVAKFDWSEDVKVTNTAAVARLNIS